MSNDLHALLFTFDQFVQIIVIRYHVRNSRASFEEKSFMVKVFDYYEGGNDEHWGCMKHGYFRTRDSHVRRYAQA